MLITSRPLVGRGLGACPGVELEARAHGGRGPAASRAGFGAAATIFVVGSGAVTCLCLDLGLKDRGVKTCL